MKLYPLTLVLSTSQNRNITPITFRSHERCCGVSMMGSLASSFTVSPHRDYVNKEWNWETVIHIVW
jgi:hypothetical protein